MLNQNIESLSDYLPRDLVVFRLEIDLEAAKGLKLRPVPGVTLSTDSDLETNEPKPPMAEIEFRVVDRRHDMCRDWADPYKLGYRSTGTTIAVEPGNPEIEDIYLEIKGKFDQQFDELIQAGEDLAREN